MNIATVWYWPVVPPAIVGLPSNMTGSVNRVSPPMVEMNTVKMIVGRSIGTVICQNCRLAVAPSMAAAS